MKLFVNSLPKSGTNLVEKLVNILGFDRTGRGIASSSIVGRHNIIKSILHQDHFRGNSVPVGLATSVSVSAKWLERNLSIQDGQYVSGHAQYSFQLASILKKKEVKTIFVHRDPRAVLVSWCTFVGESQNEHFPFFSAFKDASVDDAVEFCLKGGEVNGIIHSPFEDIYERSMKWCRDDSVLNITYEQLVGEEGGGSSSDQIDALSKLCQFMGKKDIDIESLANQVYGGTHTFRGGSIDGWRDKVSKETASHLDLMFDQAGARNA